MILEIHSLSRYVSDCPYVQNEPYLIDLIAADDACPYHKGITVRVTLIVEPPIQSGSFFMLNQKGYKLYSTMEFNHTSKSYKWFRSRSWS